MMDAKDLAKATRPQSSRYRCLIEELEKSRMVLYQIENRARTMNNTLIEIAGAIERMLDGQTRTQTGPGSYQQNPVGVETDSRIVDVSGEAFVGSFPPPPATLSGVSEKHDSPPGYHDVEIEPPLGGQTATQRDEAEKARRVRHGEGLDLDEPQF